MEVARRIWWDSGHVLFGRMLQGLVYVLTSETEGGGRVKDCGYDREETSKEMEVV